MSMKFMFDSGQMVPEKAEITPYLCAHKVKVSDLDPWGDLNVID